MTFFKSLPNIVGANALVNLGTIATANSLPTQAAWVQISKSATGGSTTLGGSEVTATRGLPISAGGYFFAPKNGSDITDFADLNKMNLYVATGDTVYVLYGG
jgi:hypothetical protein